MRPWSHGLRPRIGDLGGDRFPCQSTHGQGGPRVDPSLHPPASSDHFAVLACRRWNRSRSSRFRSLPIVAVTPAIPDTSALYASILHRQRPGLRSDFDAPRPANWHHFLQQLFSGDSQSIDLLQDWFGYCLTGDTSQHKMLLIVGPPPQRQGHYRTGAHAVGRLRERWWPDHIQPGRPLRPAAPHRQVTGHRQRCSILWRKHSNRGGKAAVHLRGGHTDDRSKAPR